MTNLLDDTIYNRFNSWSVMYHSERLKEIAEEGMTRPVTMHIYPTNKCTHKCGFCIMAEDKKGQEELDRNTYLRTINEAIDLGVKCIHFSGGGEPMLNQATQEAINIAKAGGITTIVSTNGSLTLPHADHIRVSLNAGTKETHEKIMGAKTWDKIIKNIKDFKNKDKVGLGYVLTDENWGEVYEFCKLASELGVNFVHIRPGYIPRKDSRIQELLPAVKGLTDQAKKDFPNLNIYSVKEKFDGYWTPRKYSECLATPINIVVKANGRLITCQDRMDLEFGNIYKSSLYNIWYSEEHYRIIKKIRLKECPRCVMTKVNEIIKNVYIDNKTINELI